MSRLRIKEKVRKNPDFEVVSAELDRLRLPWELHAATGKGHPILRIEIAGVTHRRPVACTPAARLRHGQVLGELRRWLRARGVDV